MTLRGICLVVASALLFSASAAGEGHSALVSLLNSRSAQSPSAYAKATEEVRREADKGGILQRYVIALISEDRNSPPAARLDEKTRHAWLDNGRERLKRLAEKNDNSLAWFLLSLENGDGAMLERAAEGGNVQAQNAWGTQLISSALAMPATNEVVARARLEKGFACFASAAGKADANGLYNLGMCYQQGYGCEPDAARAFECFRSAAERGHPEAINNIGGFYRDGILVPTNAFYSARWFRKSAELGNPYGQLNYALALQRGDGEKKDEKEAVEWLAKATEQGCLEAMDAYAMCLHIGRGVKKNPEKAFRLFRASAEGGFPPAMDNLATCYGQGIGTPRDILKSALWKMRYRGACGDPDALAWLRQNDK